MNYQFVISLLSKGFPQSSTKIPLWLVWNLIIDVHVADCCFLCVTEVLTDIAPIYALNGHRIREITLCAFTD